MFKKIALANLVLVQFICCNNPPFSTQINSSGTNVTSTGAGGSTAEVSSTSNASSQESSQSSIASSSSMQSSSTGVHNSFAFNPGACDSSPVQTFTDWCKLEVPDCNPKYSAGLDYCVAEELSEISYFSDTCSDCVEFGLLVYCCATQYHVKTGACDFGDTDETCGKPWKTFRTCVEMTCTNL